MKTSVQFEQAGSEELFESLAATGIDGEVVRLEDVRRVYHTGEVEAVALCGVSLSIHRGEFVAIMGPSGSGKSTMMNIIGCLDRPSGGRYLLGGIDVSTVPKAELADIRNRLVGFVFQNFNLLPRTSAFENVELPMVYANVPSRERALRVRQALSLVGLGAKEGSYPNQLSGGEQQRVAIARALVNRPSIILADEPTGSLDTHTSEEVMGIFAGLNREHGMTIVLVTHEPDIAAFAHRQIRLRDGQIVEDTASGSAIHGGEAGSGASWKQGTQEAVP